MRKLLEILRSAGVEIPEDKQADVKRAFFESYKSVGEFNKTVGKLTEERDGYKGQLETATATLQGFEGMDPEQVKKELDEWRQKAEDAERSYQAQITARDQSDWLKAKLDEYGVASPFSRKQLMTECMDEKSGLKWKGVDVGFYGFDDFMKAAKAQDASLYQTAEEKAAAQEAARTAEAAKDAPRFTGPAGDTAPSGGGAPRAPLIF